MTVSSSGEATLNQYPVNFQLMRMLLMAAKTRCPFFSGTNQGELSMNAGTASVKWERIENLSPVPTPLTEINGALTFPTRAAVVPTITPITATMAKYGNVIQVTEELELMSVNARAMKFMVTLGENAGATYNAVMAAVYAAATQVRFGGGVAAVTLIVTGMSANDIKFAVNLVNRQGGMKFRSEGFGSTNIGTNPIRSSYMGICHVDVEEDIRDLPTFVPVENYGGYTDTWTDEIGAVNGVRWVATEEPTLITADAATTSAPGFRGTSDVLNDVYDSYVVAVDAVGSVGLGERHTREIYLSGDRIPTIQLIRHEPGSAGAADPLNELSTVSWKGWLVGQILNNTWIVRIRTLASDLA
jgi:N4-gp56 family major capsid protein